MLYVWKPLCMRLWRHWAGQVQHTIWPLHIQTIMFSSGFWSKIQSNSMHNNDVPVLTRARKMLPFFLMKRRISYGDSTRLWILQSVWKCRVHTVCIWTRYNSVHLSFGHLQVSVSRPLGVMQVSDTAFATQWQGEKWRKKVNYYINLDCWKT